MPIVQVAHGGPEHDRAADHLAEADGAVGGLRVDAGAGPLDGDVAVGGAHPQVAGDRVDRGVAVGVLDHRGALDLADLDLAGAGGDLGVAGDVVGGDVTGAVSSAADRSVRARRSRRRS